MTINNLRFSGHDSFHCRSLWLKKGFDFIYNGNNFTEGSGVDLGIGKNMVEAVKHWLKAFNVIDNENTLSDWSKVIFSDDGLDPYLEDENTLWLLHFQIVNKGYASAYNLLFSELRKVSPDFSNNTFVNYIKEIDIKQNENTLNRDFSTLIRTYFVQKENDKEESYSGLLQELNLVHEEKSNSQFTSYHIENRRHEFISPALLLYCIMSSVEFDKSISVKSLIGKGTTIGNIFALTPEMIEQKLIKLSEIYPNFVYVNDSGIKELQIKGEKPELIEILKLCYDN